MQLLLQFIYSLHGVFHMKEVLDAVRGVACLILGIKYLEARLLLWLGRLLLLYLSSLDAAHHGLAVRYTTSILWLLLRSHGYWTLMT